MINICKKQLCILLSFCLSLSGVVCGFAAPAQPEPQAKKTVIDFGDAETWTALDGMLPQFTKDETVAYGEKTSSAKVTDHTSNITGYIDLAEFGFETDWSNYDTINIRYKTSNTEYVPPVRMATRKDWVASGQAETDNAYKLNKGLYTSKKATTADEWTVVSYKLMSDFTKRHSNNLISQSNIPYLHLPTANLKEMWNKDDNVTYINCNLDDSIYIDSIWLETEKLANETEIDFSSDNDWKAIGEDKQFSKSTEQPYGENTQSAKITAETNNWDYFFNLKKMGFATDWSDYTTLKIRYYTDDATKVPAAYLATGKGWVNSQGIIGRTGYEDITNQGAYRLKSGTYAKKKPTAAGWNTVTYILPTVSAATDFELYPKNNTAISIDDIPYLLIPNSAPKQYWQENDTAPYDNITGMYIDKVWLENDQSVIPTPTPTPTAAATPTTKPSTPTTAPSTSKLASDTAIDFSSDNDWAVIGEDKQFGKSTEQPYTGKTQSAKVKKATDNWNYFFDLKKIGFKTDWTGYNTLKIRYYTTDATKVPAAYLANGEGWVNSQGKIYNGNTLLSENNGAYKLKSGTYANKKPSKTGWNTVTYVLPTVSSLTDFSLYPSNATSMKMNNVPYLLIPNHYSNQYFGESTEPYNNITGMYIDRIWIENDTNVKPTPTPTPTTKPSTPTTAPSTSKLTSNTAIDFTKDKDWTAIGSMVQLSKDTTKGYGKATQSAKISGTTSNETGFFDLKKIGFTTDWSNYDVLKIRYYTPEAGKLPPVYLPTVQKWVTSTGLDGTAGSYKLKAGTYAKKKPTAPGWYTVSFVLPKTGVTSDFSEYGDTTKLSLANVPYLMLPNSQPGQYWGDGAAPYNNITGLYIDKIWLDTNHPDFTFEQSYFPASGNDAMPVTGASFSFKADGKLKDALEFKPTFKKNSSTVNLSIDTDFENDFVVSFKDTLDYDTTYSVTGTLIALDIYDREVQIPISYTFKTVKKGIESSLKLTQGGKELRKLPSNGEIKGEAILSNNTQSAAVFKLNICVYDKEGKVVAGPKSETYTLNAGETNVNKSVAVTYANYTDCSVRAWITDGNGKPISPLFAGLGTGCELPFAATMPSGTKSITVSAKGDIDKVAINGKETNGLDYVLITFENENGVMISMPVYPSSDGTYAVSLKPNDSVATGFYKVKVVTYAGISAVAENVPYIGNTDRAKIYNDIKNATSADGVLSVLNPFKQYLGYTESELASISLVLYEQKASFADYKAMLTLANKAIDLLETVNKTHWSGIYDLVAKEENTKILTNNSDDWKKFAALGETERNMKAQELQNKLPAADIAAFRAALKTALNTSTATPTPTPTTKPGGGGGGGGQVSVGVKNPTPTPEPINPDTNNNKNYSFSDIENHWGRDYIENLYKQGIVSSSDDEKFRPDDLITREEFIKLIVSAAGLTKVSGENVSFTDVNGSEWFAEYVATAVAYGITDGYENGAFGIGDNISRQDAAVLCWRALNRKYTQSDKSERFADDSAIGDYAKEAVYELRALGLISGYDDNSFNPGGTLTRAEAAKMITVFMNIIRG